MGKMDITGVTGRRDDIKLVDSHEQRQICGTIHSSTEAKVGQTNSRGKTGYPKRDPVLEPT